MQCNVIRSEREGTMLSRGSPKVVSIGTSYVHYYSMTSDRVSCESNSKEKATKAKGSVSPLNILCDLLKSFP